MTLLSNKAFISQLDLMLDRNIERSFGVSVGFLLVRYPVIDSAADNHCPARNARFDDYESFCLGKQSVASVRINRRPY